jgi:hypothetical protein
MSTLNSGVFDLEVVGPRMREAAREVMRNYRGNREVFRGLSNASGKERIPPEPLARMLDAWCAVARRLLAERAKKGMSALEFDAMQPAARAMALADTSWGFERFLRYCLDEAIKNP